jgi:hypothetical protein
MANEPKKPDPRKPVVIPDAFEIPEAEEIGGEAFVDFGGVASIHEGASGVIPIADLPDPPSGQSLTSWTEVIRRQRATHDPKAKSPPEALAVDSPSDKYLIDQIMPGEDSNTDEIQVAAISELPESQADFLLPPIEPLGTNGKFAAVDFSELLPPTGQTSGGGSEVRFEIGNPPSDAGGIMPPPAPLDLPPITDFMRPPSSDSMILRQDEVPFPSADDNADIGNFDSKFAGSDDSRSSILDVLLSEAALSAPSGVDYRQQTDFAAPPSPMDAPPMFPPPAMGPRAGNSTAKNAVPTQANFEFPSAAELPPIPDAPPGGWKTPLPSDSELPGFAAAGVDDDLGSDEAVDLYADNAPIPSISDSGSLEISDKIIEEAERKARMIESSAVDLSSRPSFHSSEFEMAKTPEGMRRQLGSVDEIDLNLPYSEDQASSSIVHQGHVPNDPNSLATALDARRRSQGYTAQPGYVEPAETYAAREPENVRANRGKGSLLAGAAIGLLLGAGGVGAVWFGGLLPNKDAGTGSSTEVADAKQALMAANADASKVRSELEGLKASAETARTSLAESEKTIANLKTQAQTAAAAATTSKQAEELAKKNLEESTKTLTAANRELTATKKGVEEAKAEAASAKKAAEDQIAMVAKQLKDAGASAPKIEDALKQLTGAKAAAEAKEKELAEKLTENEKKVTELAKAATEAKKTYDAAVKTAEDANTAKLAGEAVVKAVVEKLEKAKFIAANANSTALLKGLDDAIKAGATDSTKDLRDELVKVREASKKAEADLASATTQLQAAVKLAETSKAAGEQAMTNLKTAGEKAAALKAENDLLKTKTDTLTAKVEESTKLVNAARRDSEKMIEEARTATDRAAREAMKLKADNDALAREMVRIKEQSFASATTSPGTTGTTVMAANGPRIETAMLAEKLYGEGVISLRDGNLSKAQKSLTDAIAQNGEDARYHYLLGIAKWMQGDTASANAEFEKGRRLEIEGKPGIRLINSALERVQGTPRQAVNAFRP